MTRTLRVVVADDSAIFRTAVIALLRRLPNVRVVGEAEEGEAALRHVDKLAPDLLLLDLHMPKLNGWEVLRRLAVQGAQVHVIILSAYATPNLYELATSLGATAYFVKDEIQPLVNAIAELVKAINTPSVASPAP
jgi:DNA-binding NarL/FixJ family response regulator